MNYLVTGGAGFIGSNFIDYMLAQHPHCRIVCLDKLTYAADMSNLANALPSPRFTFVKGDICAERALDKLFEREKFDAVINFAAETHVDRSIKRPSVFLKSNVLGVQALADCCVKYGVRLHHISTDEVYGDLPLGSSVLLNEESALRPSSPYAASKAAADLLIAAYCRTYGLKATISRCCNNYGPNQYAEKLIPLAISHIQSGRPVPLYGNGLNVRDWLYVEDHCRAVDIILQRGECGQVYNVAAHCELDNLTLVKKLLAAIGAEDNLIKFVPDRKGHDLRYGIDDAKLRAIGWQISVAFEEGLKRTIAHYTK